MAQAKNGFFLPEPIKDAADSFLQCTMYVETVQAAAMS